jgi:hypothetical protein
MKTKHSIRKKRKHNFVKSVFISVFSLLFAAFTTQIIPPIIIYGLQIEFFLLLLAYGLFLFVLHKIARKLFYGFIALCLMILLGFSLGGIGWQPQIILDNAKGNVVSIFKNISSLQVGIIPPQTATYPHISLQQRIQQKIDYKNSTIRDFAIKHSLLYFDEYYPKYKQICRQFSLIKYIKDHYKYVSDPSGFDYFASPIESIDLMAGDCDDYSIMTASTLKAIGANIRIVWSPGHVYPELFCGDKISFDKYVSAIYVFFEQEIGKKPIYYRMDKSKNYWLNIDFTDKYPGSFYQSEEVLSFIYIK